jgi:hypothetical protein
MDAPSRSAPTDDIGPKGVLAAFATRRIDNAGRGEASDWEMSRSPR